MLWAHGPHFERPTLNSKALDYVILHTTTKIMTQNKTSYQFLLYEGMAPLKSLMRTDHQLFVDAVIVVLFCCGSTSLLHSEADSTQHH